MANALLAQIERAAGQRMRRLDRGQRTADRLDGEARVDQADDVHRDGVRHRDRVGIGAGRGATETRAPGLAVGRRALGLLGRTPGSAEEGEFRGAVGGVGQGERAECDGAVRGRSPRVAPGGGQGTQPRVFRPRYRRQSRAALRPARAGPGRPNWTRVGLAVWDGRGELSAMST